MYDVIIVGGGAAGLFLAANLKNKKVLLLERMTSPGKKILITGGGMCNLTNTDDVDLFLTHFGTKQKANFLKPSLKNLSPIKLQEWFQERGLPLITRKDGKVFPSSLKAQSVVDVLKRVSRQNNTEIKTNQNVRKIEKEKDYFSVTTQETKFKTLNLVIASGGKSYETTGSNGSGYVLAHSLGHRIIDPSQALVAVDISDYPFVEMAGNSIQSSFLDFYRKDESRRYLSVKGDLLFTHKGLSGPVILNNSRQIKKGDIVSFSLIETNNKEESKKDLINLLTENSKKQIKSVLKNLGIFSGLNDHIFSLLAFKKGETCANLNKKKRTQLVSTLLDYRLTIAKKGAFSTAMVTSGGIDLQEVNRLTMESRLVKNLFFAGEVLDFDGDTGGYNLQAAFSTAFSIATAIL